MICLVTMYTLFYYIYYYITVFSYHFSFFILFFSIFFSILFSTFPGAQTATAQAILRNAGLSVISAAKIFWDLTSKVFEEIGDEEKSVDDTFEAIVGKIRLFKMFSKL